MDVISQPVTWVVTRWVQFHALIGTGESGDPAVVAGNPDASSLIELITPDESGVAAMPQDEPPLTEQEVLLIRQWIEQGAVNDSPTQTVNYSRQHPPEYRRLPVVTSLDFSPDGQLLATAGFHEAVLVDVGSQKDQAPPRRHLPSHQNP